MKDLNETLHKALESQLKNTGYDMVDFVPIPQGKDRFIQLQTLEEALKGFDGDDHQETISYLIQVKVTPEPTDRRSTVDGVYMTDGKINVPYLLKNAHLLFSAGEYHLAKNVYRTVLQSGEKSAHALYWIGRCFEAEGKWSEAQRTYEESIAYYPDLESFQRLAAVLIRVRRDQQAAELLERTLDIKGLKTQNRLELHLTCGNCWLRSGKTEEAERHYKSAMAIDPDSEAAYLNLGSLALQKKDYQEAKRLFQRVLTLNSKSPKALSGVASAHLALGEKRAAHDAFAKSLDLQIQNPTAVFHLVKCAYEIKSYATAARVLEEYIQSAPVNANLLYSLAGLQFHLGRMEEAFHTTQRILELQPEHAGAAELKSKIESMS